MSIKKYLKQEGEEVERKLLQARIDSVLYEKLRAKLKKNKVEIRQFIEAAVKAYLEEK